MRKVDVALLSSWFFGAGAIAGVAVAKDYQFFALLAIAAYVGSVVLVLKGPKG